MDDNKVDLKVEDGEEKKEEDNDLEVSEKDVDGKIDNNKEVRPKNTKEIMNHSWEEVNYEQAPWNISKDNITKEEYKGLYRSLTKQDGADASSHILIPKKVSVKSISSPLPLLLALPVS